MGIRRRKRKVRTRVIPREEINGGAAPEKKQTSAGDDAVTQDDLQAVIAPIVSVVKTIGESVQQLNETLNGGRGIDSRTDAELQEIGERQLKDAEQINRQKVPAKIFGAPTLHRDALFKNIHANMRPYEIEDAIQNVLSSDTDDELVKEFQNRYDRIKLDCELLNKLPYQLKRWVEHEAWLEKTGIGKVLNLVSAPSGFIPQGWSMEVLSYYYQALRVASAFEEYPMERGVEMYPIIGRPTAQHQATRGTQRGNTTDEFSATTPEEGVTIFHARTLHVRVDLMEEYVEDSNVMETLLRLIPEAMAEGMESLIINGNRATGNTHQDNDIAVAAAAGHNPIEKAFDGIRRLALERGSSATLDIEAGSGTFGFDDYSRLLEKGSTRLHVMPEDCCWILPNAVYTKSMRFSQLETWDKNPLPTNINGVVGMILGRPVIVSGKYPQNLDATGVNSTTAANNVHTGFAHVNHRELLIGNRRAETVSVVFDNETGSYRVIATSRRDLKTRENRRSGYTPAITAINITTAS